MPAREDSAPKRWQASNNLPGMPRNEMSGELDAWISSAPGEENNEKRSPKKQVNAFGWALSVAIREFRCKVEDIFDDYCEAVEYADTARQLEVARLRAENDALRERLGLQCEGPRTFQEIQFDPAVPPPEERRKRMKGQEEKIWADIRGDLKPKDANKNPDAERVLRSGTNVGGGTWEHFVAWVPSGAALQCPQPWKPLPSEAFTAPSEPVQIVDPNDDDSNEDNTWKVLDVWAVTKEELKEMRTATNNMALTSVVPHIGSKNSVSPLATAVTQPGLEELQDAPGPRLILHPHSRRRISWDIASLLLVIYDMVTIPLETFDWGNSAFVIFMSWLTRVFWTMDVPMSLSTGVVLANGSVEMKFKFIFKRYLKTWFAMDLFIIGSDWLEYGIASGGGGGGLGRIARVFRIFRAIRLLRLVRMKDTVSAMTERIQSEKLSLVLNIGKLVVFLVSFAHVAACVWWGIGSRDAADAWAVKYDYIQNTVGSQYLVSLHWTLSQFSGGMEEIRPASDAERFFVVLFWIISFFSAALIVSVVTSSLVQLHIIGGSHSRQMATLKKYLNQNSISSNLALRVQRNAKHAISGDLTPDAVDLLSMVSEQLRLDMHFEIYSELFCAHPFFDQCRREGNQVMRRLCHIASSTVLLDDGDVVFSKGEIQADPRMYFVAKGTLEYVSSGGYTGTLSAGMWIAEPVLWTQWTHRGTLTATSDVKLARLDSKMFCDIMERFKEVFQGRFNPKLYAHDYVAHLCGLDVVNDFSGIHSSAK